MINYVVTHCHTDISNGITNIDSVTKYNEYIEKAKELGMKAIAITEHGSIMNWYKKKLCCEENGLKYIHAIEAYLTETLDEKVRDNYHCCLYARNYEGFKELNKLVSKSFNKKDNHFYYTPRILIDDLFKTSDNIIISSACLGGVFNKGNENIKKRMLDFYIKNKDRCFLEIQHHNVRDQIEYNKYLWNLSKQYELQLIAATDTHCLNETHSKGRSILQKSKNIYFDNEEGWDLTFKTYDELVECFKQQYSLPIDIILNAIENTNRLADMIEEFEIDRSYKYPKIYNNPENVLKQKINEGVIKRGINKYDNYKTEYLPRIYEELETYKHNKAIDFLLLDEGIKSWAREKGAYCGYSRGSCSGSLICYLIGITEIDSIKYNLNFSRFMNKERVSLADIDTDWGDKDRDLIKKHIHEDLGLYCAEIVTFNTVALKGSIRDVCRAIYTKEVPQWLEDKYEEECEHYGKPTDETSKLYLRFRDGEYLKIADTICNNIETDEDSLRREYPEIFEYVDIINGTIVSIGIHPCGSIVSPIPLDENVGLMYLSTCEYPVTMLNMKELDSQNFVKLDVLGLDNVTLINETCKLAGIDRLTPDNIDDNDEDVWMSIRDNTLGIFQWEGSGSNYIKDLFSDETIKKIKGINPNFKYIDLLSVGNGAIRPAGSSYRQDLAKGNFYYNGCEAIDNLLSPTLGRVVYQEQIIAFLNQFCGYSMGAADLVRRGFAKKTGTEQFIPNIEKGFIKTMKEEYNMEDSQSKEVVKSFLQVVIDASSYLLSENHSLPYSYIGYICGYLRYYYPLEFFTVFLNINKDNAEKTGKALEYMKTLNITFNSPKFRYSKAEYFFNKETNSIYKGIESIKFLNSIVAKQLYDLRDNQYNSFLDLLIDLENTSINSRQLQILIKLDFFSEFGKRKYLLNIVDIYNKWFNKKTFKKNDLPLSIEKFRPLAEKEIDKQFTKVDNRKLCELMISVLDDEDLSINEILAAEQEYVGSLSYETNELGNRAVYVMEINTKYTPRIKCYSLVSGNATDIKISKKIYKKDTIKQGDIVILGELTTKHKKKND